VSPRRGTAASRALAPALAALLAACGPPEPAPRARVLSATPVGPEASPVGVEARITFTAPVAAEALRDGARLVLVPAAALREALAAVEADEGAAGLAAAIPAVVTLEEGGTCAALRPDLALRAHAPYALVLSSRLRAADGRAVLDAEGRRRPTVAAFETGAAPGPPPRPVLTEARFDAATPEAGGEYVEVANLGDGPFDPSGFRLAKRTVSGAVSSCAIAGGEVVPPGGLALIVGEGWDGRYPLPAGIGLLVCGGATLLGGLANDHPPAVLLLDPGGIPVSTFGAAGAPICPAAALRLVPDGPDEPANLGCAEGEGTAGLL
jgi:hypothetical protein